MLSTSHIFRRLRRWPKPLTVLGLKHYCKDSEDAEIKEKHDNGEKVKRRMEAKQRMQDLLQSLKKGSFPTAEAVKLARPKPPEQKPEPDKPSIDSSLKKAVKRVAETLEGDPKQTESELLEAVQSMTARREDLSNVLSSMKVMKEALSDSSHHYLSPPRSSLQNFREDIGMVRQEPPVKLFAAFPMGIFPVDFRPSESSKESVLTTWDAAFDREKTIAFTRQPRNYFEEMIRWTERGKLWHFPVDNEVGMEEEKSYSFADHIFLERHLKGWCPSRGPIRHFMELVCVGLSKNHHIGVPRKIAHIKWFQDFFESKKDMLKDIGAV